jgi:molybdopterin molybdotransferase
MAGPLIPVEEAQARLLAAARPIGARETLSIWDADQRVLAEPVMARLTQPPFDASAMDGYAFRRGDVTAVGDRLSLIGESAAGHSFSGDVGPGQAVRIFTGAPVPNGADTVLLQEDAIRHDHGRIELAFLPDQGRHIRPRGQDFIEGETVLAQGLLLDPGRLMLAAAANHATVSVFKRPLVGIIATGDELREPGSLLGPDQIVASSIFAIAALARRAGADVETFGIVADDPKAIADTVARAQARGVDVIVTLGGASVGDHDLVQSTLIGLGMRLDFWRIAMRPGKPLMVGALGDIQVLGLPGNPVSSMVCGLLFLEPLIASLARRTAPSRAAKAITETDLAANDHRQDYLRSTLSRDDSGALIARSYGKQDSSQMKIFANSEALIIRPPNAPAVKSGETCDILVLRAQD